MRKVALLLKSVMPLAALLCTALPAWAGTAPAAVVDSLQSALIANMKSQDRCEARLKALEPQVAAAFDFDFITQKLLRKRWKNLDESQRSQLRAAVQRSAAVTYATQFIGYKGERFETLDTTASATGQRVSARLIVPGDKPVSFDYALRQTGDAWKIVNVVAQGVSDLAIRSAQYEALFARDGYAGLLRNLESNSQQALAGCGAAP